MKVEFVLLAEAANRSASGTLNIHGEFNTLYSEEFPFVRPGFVFLVRLRGSPDDTAHRIRGELVKKDSDFKIAEFETTASRMPGRERDLIKGDIIVNAYGVVFPEPGEYALNVYVDGSLEGSKALYVQPPPQPQG